MKNLNIYITEHINDPKKDEVFVIIKPGFLKKSAEIMEMIKDEGFELVKTTTKLLTLKEAQDLYKIHKKEEWYTEAYFPCRKWDLTRPGVEPMSPTLAGRFPTPGLPGKSTSEHFFFFFF